MTDTVSFFRTSDDVEIQFQHCASNHASKSPIIFCHGLGGNMVQFDQQKSFSDRYCVIAPSLRGHGKSSPPKVISTETMSIERQAQDILELADHLGLEQFHFVGHSIGSIIGLQILRQSRHRLLSLTTCGVSPKYEMKTSGFFFQLAIIRLMNRMKLHRLVYWINFRNTLSGEIYAQMFLESNTTAMLYLLRNLRKVDFMDDLKSCTRLPILIMRTDGDRTINKSLDPCIEELQTQHNIDIIRVNSAGYMPNVETPSYFNNILSSFLTKASFKDA